MSQGGDPLGDRPDAIEPQGIDRQAPERGQDLDVVVLSVAVVVFPQWHVPHPLPAVLDRPPVSDLTQQSLGTGAQTRDGVTGLIGRLAIAHAMAAHGDDRGATWPLLHHPLWSRHRSQGPGDVTTPFHLSSAGAPGGSPAVGQSVSDQPKPPAATMFDGVPLRGRLASTGSRRHAGRGREKRAVGMQRVGLHQHSLKIDSLQ